MVFRLILIRLVPLICLGACKDRKTKKISMYMILFLYCVLFLTAVINLFVREGWKMLFYIPVSMFPHAIFYGFSAWLLLRCFISAWSLRVWKRIYSLSFVGTILGILTEIFWNPRILNFFVNLF